LFAQTFDCARAGFGARFGAEVDGFHCVSL
jgi:hypothetical protein